ncbi:uncharacterized protein [Amphiura filiformis]|uniref:uncharacterized protein n=1 Tax=Amphiura filiformis TaxID=82378 RepID=UPI003B21A913
MPCWFYEKPDLINTPSFKDGIDASTEARYRREGARFIIDAGTSQGLRYDTMATGVVYFHRFYMFHSFKEFPRYVTGAACLFLAGKVEETPKKCKDIIRMAKALVPDQYFSTFGDDPKEEIMTYERILLQTIKFDLQVFHPYSYLLKYAKTIKGDKSKIQKLVQMAWTFVNDSLCTTLCLQWEPHIIATAFLYLAGRLSKSDLLDWSGKSSKVKWWDQLTDDVSLDIMEDICHQLLDLYSSGQSKGGPIPGATIKAGGKKKAAKTPNPASEKGQPASDEPREKVAKVEKSREPASKSAAPPTAPASQGAPPEVEYLSRQAPQAPPPPPKQVPAEQPPAHPAPPSTSYPVQPARPAPPTAPPPQQPVPAAPQSSQYYQQGAYPPAATVVAASSNVAPATYATAAPQQTYTTVPSQPYQAPQAAAAPPPAQPAYQTTQYGAAPYNTQYYGQQQSTYNQQYAQQPPPPTYPASAPPAPPAATTQAAPPVQYHGTQYTGQYHGQSVPAQSQPSFDPSIPPPNMQVAPTNVPHPSMNPPPPSHQPPLPTQAHPPPSHLPPAHPPPNYPPQPHHPPPPQNYAAPPPTTPTTPTVPQQSQPYRYNPAPYPMQQQTMGVPRGPPPQMPLRGPAPAPNASTGLATVRISSRDSGGWGPQHRQTSQAEDEWD